MAKAATAAASAFPIWCLRFRNYYDSTARWAHYGPPNQQHYVFLFIFSRFLLLLNIQTPPFVRMLASRPWTSTLHACVPRNDEQNEREKSHYLGFGTHRHHSISISVFRNFIRRNFRIFFAVLFHFLFYFSHRPCSVFTVQVLSFWFVSSTRAWLSVLLLCFRSYVFFNFFIAAVVVGRRRSGIMIY